LRTLLRGSRRARLFWVTGSSAPTPSDYYISFQSLPPAQAPTNNSAANNVVPVPTLLPEGAALAGVLGQDPEAYLVFSGSAFQPRGYGVRPAGKNLPHTQSRLDMFQVSVTSGGDKGPVQINVSLEAREANSTAFRKELLASMSNVTINPSSPGLYQAPKLVMVVLKHNGRPYSWAAPGPVRLVMEVLRDSEILAAEAYEFELFAPPATVTGATGTTASSSPATVSTQGTASGSTLVTPAISVGAPATVTPLRLTGAAVMSVSVDTQGNATLVGSAVGGSGPLRYQWVLNGRVIPGAVGSSYQVRNQLALATYVVIVTDGAGQGVVQTFNVIGSRTKAVIQLSVLQSVTAGNPLTLGFSTEKPTEVLFRASSVSLQACFGVTGTTPSTKIVLHKQGVPILEVDGRNREDAIVAADQSAARVGGVSVAGRHVRGPAPRFLGTRRLRSDRQCAFWRRRCSGRGLSGRRVHFS